MRRRMLGSIAVAAVLTLVLGACAKSTPNAGGSSSSGTGSPSPTQAALTTLTPGTLLVGSCLNYKPFEYYVGGDLKGFDVEIMDAIGSKLGLQVEWKKANFETIFTALAANQFDAVAAASSITAERQQVIDFSDPYFNALLSLTVNTSKSPNITSTDQLTSSDIVGVQKGTTGKDWASANLASKGVQIKTYSQVPDAYTDLEAGQITAVVDDQPSALGEVSTRPTLKAVQSIDAQQFYGIAVAKNHTDIKDAINGALKEIIADGTYQQLFQKYFPDLTLPDQFKPTA
jgi:ABC-type amino acid transport substrate-binding protein